MKRTISLWITPLTNGQVEIILHQVTLSTAHYGHNHGDGWHFGGFVNHRWVVDAF